MADVELIDAYVDRQSVKGDTDFLIAQFDSALKKFDELNAKKLTLSGASSLKDVVSGTEAVNKSIADLAAQNAKLQKSYDDLAKKMAELDKANNRLVDSESAQAKEIALVNQMRIANNKQLKIQAELELAGANSINYARAKVKELTVERNKLNLATEEGRQRQTELNKEINQYNEFIKENVDDLTKQKINIGNYGGALKTLEKSLSDIRAKLSEAKQTAASGISISLPSAGPAARSSNAPLRGPDDQATQSMIKYGKAANDTATQVADLSKQEQIMSRIVESQITGYASATAEVKANEKALQALAAAGLQNSEFYKALLKDTAELKDRIGDLKDEIKALASDTHTFDQFAGAVNFAVDTTQTFIGVMALSADSEQDVAEATKTLIALQTVANGIKGIATELTTRGTAANKIYAFAQNQVAIAMDTTATAGDRLRAALITTGIGALIIGIGLLIANFDKIKRAISGVSKQQEDYNAVMAEENKSASAEITHLRVLEKTATDLSQAQSVRVKAAKEMQQLYPALLKNLTQEEILNGKAAKAIDEVAAALLNRAYAQAAEQKAAELGAKKLDLQLQGLQLENDLEKAKKEADKADQAALKNKDKYSKEEIGLDQFTTKAKKTELIKQIDDNKAAQKKIDEDLNFFIDQAKNRQGDVQKLGEPKTGPRVRTFEFDDSAIKKEADAYKKLSEDQDAYLVMRISAREKVADLEKEILDGQLKVNLANINEKEKAERAKDKVDLNALAELNDQKKKLENKYASNRVDIGDRLNEDLFHINQSFIARQRELEDQYQKQYEQDQKDAIDKQIKGVQDRQSEELKKAAVNQQDQIESLNAWYEERVAATKEGSTKRQKVEERYAQRRAEIEYQSAVSSINTEIWAAEQILAIHKAAGGNVADEEKKIAELKKELSDAETKHAIDNEHKKHEAFQKRMQATEEALGKAQEIEGKVSDIIGGFISINVDRQKNAVQEQIDDVDKKKEKEIAALDTVTLTEQQKAEKTAIINARADAQKQALERRQRQLDLQRARFEKAANITRIAIETNLAVVHQLGSGDPYTAIGRAIAAGIIGAAQLAAAIAQPLPKFKHGRKDGPATWGVTGDGGVQEVITSPDLSSGFLTPATDTVTWLPKNWKVFPNVKEFQETAMNMVHKPLPSLPVMHDNNSALVHAMAYEIRGLKSTLSSLPIQAWYIRDGDLKGAVKKGNSWDEYIQSNI